MGELVNLIYLKKKDAGTFFIMEKLCHQLEFIFHIFFLFVKKLLQLGLVLQGNSREVGLRVCVCVHMHM